MQGWTGPSMKSEFPWCAQVLHQTVPTALQHSSATAEAGFKLGGGLVRLSEGFRGFQRSNLIGQVMDSPSSLFTCAHPSLTFRGAADCRHYKWSFWTSNGCVLHCVISSSYFVAVWQFACFYHLKVNAFFGTSQSFYVSQTPPGTSSKFSLQL